jgi:hypothetical protein
MGGAGAGGSGGKAGGAGVGGASAGAGGDGGGGASAGSGGAGGLRCSDLIGFAHPPVDPDVRETTTGSNGTFTDECAGQRALTEYYCEYETRCAPGGMMCAPYPTGEVVSRTTDCMFACGNGACMYPSP